VPLSEEDQFDIASCQFAVHYMFQTPSRANHFFAQVAAHLKPGGVFIATTMDCRVMAEALLAQIHGAFDADFTGTEAQKQHHPQQPEQYAAGVSAVPTEGASANGEPGYDDTFKRIIAIYEQRQQKAASGRGEEVLAYRNDVGSTVLRIKFQQDMWSRLLQLPPASSTNNSSSSSSGSSSSSSSGGDGAKPSGEVEKATQEEQDTAFGIQYTFTLQDTDDAAAVDAPEWVVPLGDTLRALARAHGLKLQVVQNFQDIMNEIMQNTSKFERFEFFARDLKLYCFCFSIIAF
jgi:hypothetical protein